MLYDLVANCLRPILRWARLLGELRERVPPVAAGRRPRPLPAEAG